MNQNPSVWESESHWSIYNLDIQSKSRMDKDIRRSTPTRNPGKCKEASNLHIIEQKGNSCITNHSLAYIYLYEWMNEYDW